MKRNKQTNKAPTKSALSYRQDLVEQFGKR